LFYSFWPASCARPNHYIISLFSVHALLPSFIFWQWQYYFYFNNIILYYIISDPSKRVFRPPSCFVTVFTTWVFSMIKRSDQKSLVNGLFIDCADMKIS
jgi:hypothetical protein